VFRWLAGSCRFTLIRPPCLRELGSTCRHDLMILAIHGGRCRSKRCWGQQTARKQCQKPWFNGTHRCKSYPQLHARTMMSHNSCHQSKSRKLIFGLSSRCCQSSQSSNVAAGLPVLPITRLSSVLETTALSLPTIASMDSADAYSLVELFGTSSRDLGGERGCRRRFPQNLVDEPLFDVGAWRRLLVDGAQSWGIGGPALVS